MANTQPDDDAAATDESPPPAAAPELVPGEVVAAEGPGAAAGRGETVEQPAKVMRIASMIRQLLEEVRQAPLDEGGRRRLREIYETAVEELCEGLSPDLRQELSRVSFPFADGDPPTESELRVAQAQLVGWLEGLFHGIQATMMAQQMAMRADGEARRRGLPAPEEGPGLRPPGYL